MPNAEPRLIEFHQLCAIARTTLQADPSIDDSEWKERTKLKLARQGYTLPAGDLLSRALNSVEQSMRQTMGPRPVHVPPAPQPPTPPQQDDPPWRSAQRKPVGWALVEQMVKALTVSSRQGARPPAPRPDTLRITEAEALDLFYAEVNKPGADKLRLLRVFAELAIERPAEWDEQAIRAGAANHRLFAYGCFACQGTRSVEWHHIIQVQFGGSNTPRNRTALCPSCHAAIHPWLGGMPTPETPTRGWTSLADLAGRVVQGAQSSVAPRDVA